MNPSFERSEFQHTNLKLNVHINFFNWVWRKYNIVAYILWINRPICNISPRLIVLTSTSLKDFQCLLERRLVFFSSNFSLTPRSLKAYPIYLVGLIPKVYTPQSLGEFRPISLLGSLYKLDASRLASVMDKTISSNQSALLKGRQLVVGVVGAMRLWT